MSTVERLRAGRDNSGMRTIEVKQLKYDLTPVAGLALVGDHLKTLEPVLARLDAALPVRGGGTRWVAAARRTPAARAG